MGVHVLFLFNSLFDLIIEQQGYSVYYLLYGL